MFSGNDTELGAEPPEWATEAAAPHPVRSGRRTTASMTVIARVGSSDSALRRPRSLGRQWTDFISVGNGDSEVVVTTKTPSRQSGLDTKDGRARGRQVPVRCGVPEAGRRARGAGGTASWSSRLVEAGRPQQIDGSSFESSERARRWFGQRLRPMGSDRLRRWWKRRLETWPH